MAKAGAEGLGQECMVFRVTQTVYHEAAGFWQSLKQLLTEPTLAKGFVYLSTNFL